MSLEVGRRWLGLVAWSLGALACSSGTASDPIVLGGGAGGAGAPADEPKAFASPRAVVRFKGGERLRNDYAAALALDPGEVCNELGRLSCVDEVHRVALGGVDAYVAQVFLPAPSTGATTPLAVERMALSACVERSRRDFAAPDRAVLWSGLEVDAAGNLNDPDGAAAREAIARLYRRALGRESSGLERERLSSFYAAVREQRPAGAAEVWATLACFAALTTTEALFF
ncbi:MAG TPA: hypothetical protein VFS43_01150 [Polyangiaceae bacterium]|nr:hypothetical protein [Polyangiaceae bacterium]